MKSHFIESHRNGRPSRVSAERRRRAFSLVEVVIALGVISFCLLSVIGILPVGLTTLHRAIDQTVEGQIAQRLGSEIALMPFSRLESSFSERTFYFDQEGSPLSARPDSGYEVNTKLGPVTYPGSAKLQPESAQNMRTVKVEVIRLPVATVAARFNLPVVNAGN